jgi:sarcosine oxidase gamma subunit
MADFIKLRTSSSQDMCVTVPLHRVYASGQAFLLTPEQHVAFSAKETQVSGDLILAHTQKVNVSPGQTEIRFQNVSPGDWFVYVQTGVASL